VDQIIRIGLDTSKQNFQLHGVNAAEEPVLRRKLRRTQMMAFFAAQPRTVIGIEAGGAAHHWSRTLSAMGHEVRIMAPQFVKPGCQAQRGVETSAEIPGRDQHPSGAAGRLPGGHGGRPDMAPVPSARGEHQPILTAAVGWPGRNATTTWITIMPASRAMAISSGTRAIASADCAAVMNLVRVST
jgi:hypothetical protein